MIPQDRSLSGSAVEWGFVDAQATATVVPNDQTGTFTPPGPPRGAWDPLRPAPPGYRFLARLGAGGVGEVYLAEEVGSRRRVALKVLRDISGDSRQRLQVEATALATLQTPYIVELYSVIVDAAEPYFTMEYIPGQTLEQCRVGAGKQVRLIPGREAVRLLIPVAHALAAAHAAKLIHRDIKPSNIMLGDDGSVKVLDFGLAKRLDEDSDLTATNAVLGTPSYMAPEQAAHQAEAVGPRTDIYAVGATLYALVGGQPPYKGATPQETVELIIRGDEKFSFPRPAWCPVLAEICRRCLARDPKDRYPSAAALAAELQNWLDGQPTLAVPPTRWQRARTGLKRRRPKARSMSLGLGMIALAGAGWWGNPVLAPPARSKPGRAEVTPAVLGRPRPAPLFKAGRQVLVDENSVATDPEWRLGRVALDPAGGLTPPRLTVVAAGEVSPPAAVVPAAPPRCIFSGQTYSLLELAPAPPWDGYVYRVEVRRHGVPDHYKLAPRSPNSAFAELGLYFGYQAQPQAQPALTAHRYLAVHFNDLDHSATRVTPATYPLYVEASEVRDLASGRTERTNHPLAPAAPFTDETTVAGDGPWRALSVEVRPTGIEVFWQTRHDAPRVPVHSATAATLQGHYDALHATLAAKFPDTEVAPTTWHPRMPLGVVAMRQFGEFRNATLEPLE